MKLTLLGPAYIILAALLWAFDGVLRRSLFSLPPITIVFYEHLIGLICIAPFFIPKLLKRIPSKREFGSIVLVSLLSGLLGTLWFTTALARVNFISFSVVFLIQKLQPVFAISAARLLLKERVHKKYILWSSLALLAAYFVTFPNGVINIEQDSHTIIAMLYALGAAFAWGTSTAFSRYSLLKQSGTVMTGLRFLITTIFAFFAFMLLQDSSTVLTPLSMEQVLRLVFIALSTGMLALWIYYQGLKWTEAKIATILELVFPVTAVFIDIIVYGNVLRISQYVAALVLLAAVYKVSQLNKRTPVRFYSQVVSGHGEGRKTGFPTLNLIIPKRFPFEYGVYAGRLYIGDSMHFAAIHFGPIPVFKREEPSLEIYVLDVHLDSVPQDMSFELIRRIRDVRFFETPEDLARQIEQDVVQVRGILATL